MSEDKKESCNPETCHGRPETCTPEELKKCDCEDYFESCKKDKKEK